MISLSIIAEDSISVSFRCSPGGLIFSVSYIACIFSSSFKALKYSSDNNFFSFGAANT